MQIPWNAPESIVTLDSSGVYVLDTTYVPDVLGLRTRFPDAGTVKVLQGRAQESVRILIPDDKVTVRGFHDVILVDMASAVKPVVPVGYFATSVACFGGVRYDLETDGPGTYAAQMQTAFSWGTDRVLCLLWKEH